MGKRMGSTWVTKTFKTFIAPATFSTTAAMFLVGIKKGNRYTSSIAISSSRSPIYNACTHPESEFIGRFSFDCMVLANVIPASISHHFSFPDFMRLPFYLFTLHIECIQITPLHSAHEYGNSSAIQLFYHCFRAIHCDSFTFSLHTICNVWLNSFLVLMLSRALFSCSFRKLYLRPKLVSMHQKSTRTCEQNNICVVHMLARMWCMVYNIYRERT